MASLAALAFAFVFPEANGLNSTVCEERRNEDAALLCWRLGYLTLRYSMLCNALLASIYLGNTMDLLLE